MLLLANLAFWAYIHDTIVRAKISCSNTAVSIMPAQSLPKMIRNFASRLRNSSGVGDNIPSHKWQIGAVGDSLMFKYWLPQSWHLATTNHLLQRGQSPDEKCLYSMNSSVGLFADCISNDQSSSWNSGEIENWQWGQLLIDNISLL